MLIKWRNLQLPHRQMSFLLLSFLCSRMWTLNMMAYDKYEQSIMIWYHMSALWNIWLTTTFYFHLVLLCSKKKREWFLVKRHDIDNYFILHWRILVKTKINITRTSTLGMKISIDNSGSSTSPICLNKHWPVQMFTLL